MPTFRKVPPPQPAEPAPTKLTREQAIAGLLAKGMTLEETEEEECSAAALHAAALVRARYWSKHTPPPAPQPTAPPPPPNVVFIRCIIVSAKLLR